MDSFEKYYARSRDEARNERVIKNAAYGLKAKTREQKRQKRKAMQALLIAILFIVDLILFVAWVEKQSKESEQSQPLIWGDVEKTSVISIPVPCPAITPVETYAGYEHSATFTVTHYCGCSICCGKYSGGSEIDAYGALGRKLKPYQSVAVDKDIIPLGTTLNSSEGIQYIAEDTGSGVKGYHIDLFVGDHEEALRLGVKEIELFW